MRVSGTPQAKGQFWSDAENRVHHLRSTPHLCIRTGYGFPESGKPLNRALRDEDGDIYDIVAGKFFVVGLGESDFISLDQKYIEKFSDLFKTPEMFMRLNGKLLVLPVPDEERPSIRRQLRETKPTVSHGAKKKEHGKEER